MAALKVLVAVMGLLIVGGVAAIIYGLVTRLDLSRPRFVDGKLELPAGARVVDMAATGERLVLRVALPDAHERLIVVDLAHGQKIGTLELVQP